MKKPTLLPDTMRQSEMNLLAAQTERFDEYRKWVGFRLWLVIWMLGFLILLKGVEIYEVTYTISTCVQTK